MLDKLKNLIGGNSNGFFLELNDDDEQPKKEQTKTASTKAEKQIEADEPAFVAKEETKSEPVAETQEEKKPEPAKAEGATKSKKTSIKNNKQKSTASTSNNSAASSGGASSWEQPFWVKAMYQNNGSSNGKVEQEKTFATDYLLPTPSKSRRRPGPSLNKFKEMARQTKSNPRI
ncbi:MAG: hypothetical protein AB4368_08380 [Xenococcaceae cyanobacterium]